LIRLPLLAASGWLLAPWLHAASLSGTVKDPSGAGASGTHISLQQIPRGAQFQTTTDAQGRSRFKEAAATAYGLACGTFPVLGTGS